MADRPTLETLRQMDFFADISDEHLEQLAANSRNISFRQREIIFREHDAASDTYLISQGKVSLVICVPNVGCRQIMTLGNGEFLAWSPLLGQSRLTATARTLEPTEIISFDSQQLLTLCSQHSAFGYAFMRNTARALSERLFATRVQLMDLGGAHLPEIVMESD